MANTTDLNNIVSSINERYLMGGWCLATLVASMGGNTLVLVSSLKYNALRLDKITLVLIENIAVADLGYACYIISTFTSVIANRWVFGELFCKVFNYMHLYFGMAEIFLICALNLSKLTSLLFPLRARIRSKRTGVYIVSVVWCLPLIHIIPSIIFGRTVVFRLTYFRCEGFFANIGLFSKIIPMMTVVCAVLLPMVIVLVSIVWLLFHLAKVRGIQKQSVVTLLVVSSCYFTSFLPYGIYYVFGGFAEWKYQFDLAVYFYRFALFMCFLNFSANPIIYYITITSFRNFVKGGVSRCKFWFAGKLMIAAQRLVKSGAASRN